MKFSAVVLFAAGAYAAADWNALARAVTPVQQISDGQVQNPATAAPSYPAGNSTVVIATTGAVGTTVAPGSGGASPTGATTTGSSPATVTTNAADSLKMPAFAGLAGLAAMLAL